MSVIFTLFTGIDYTSHQTRITTYFEPHKTPTVASVEHIKSALSDAGVSEYIREDLAAVSSQLGQDTLCSATSQDLIVSRYCTAWAQCAFSYFGLSFCTSRTIFHLKFKLFCHKNRYIALCFSIFQGLVKVATGTYIPSASTHVEHVEHGSQFVRVLSL